MHITDVEALHLRIPVVHEICDGTQDALLIRVHTDAGIVGIGQAETSPHARYGGDRCTHLQFNRFRAPRGCYWRGPS